MRKALLFFSFVAVALFAQGAVTKTITGLTAGGLRAALTTQDLSVVTNLTITGAIDARDFKTMRDNMVVLAAVDLSGATVAEYIGNGGTSGTFTVIYAENEIPGSAFYNPITTIGKTSLKIFIYPASVKSIGYDAFRKCTGLTGSLIIPASVNSIGDYAFDNCSGFTGVLTLPASITSIGDYTFNYCSGLSGSLILPESLISIGNYAFSGCNKFTGSLTIPTSVTSIAVAAFSGCSGLNGSLTIPTSVQPLRIMFLRAVVVLLVL